MKKVIYYLLVLLWFSSCETVVQLQLNEGDKTLVVESYLEFSDTTDAASARVYLTESSNFYGNTSPNIVSNATIIRGNCF